MTVTPIPDHDRRTGGRCPWSGMYTLRGDVLCPDRCQATIRQLLAAALGPSARHAQMSELDGYVYLRTRDPARLGDVQILAAIRAAGLSLAGATAAVPPVYRIRRKAV